MAAIRILGSKTGIWIGDPLPPQTLHHLESEPQPFCVILKMKMVVLSSSFLLCNVSPKKNCGELLGLLGIRQVLLKKIK